MIVPDNIAYILREADVQVLLVQDCRALASSRRCARRPTGR
jgi:hypothetical protein